MFGRLSPWKIITGTIRFLFLTLVACIVVFLGWRTVSYNTDPKEMLVLTADEAVAVWKVFLVENPRYYWLSNTVSISKGMMVVNIDAAYAKSAYRKSCDEAIAAMSEACGTFLRMFSSVWPSYTIPPPTTFRA
mgnify:CR=1 FL=1